MTKIRVLLLTVLTSLILVTPVTSQTKKSNQTRQNTALATPTVTLSKSVNTISEAGGTATITATLSQATDKDVFIDFSLSGTAKHNADYEVDFLKKETARIVAGGNGEGSNNNQLNRAGDIFVDNQGNLFIADYLNQRIQKWAIGAKTGQTVATSTDPTAIHVDSLGNLYILERLNNRVQKWAPGASAGVTVAGGNGEGNAANQLNYPNDLFVDKNGNIFIVDAWNRIQKWAPNASSGVNILTGFPSLMLYRLAGDKAGNIYFYDEGATKMFKWNASTNTTEMIINSGSLGAGIGELGVIMGLHVDNDNNLYIADLYKNRIIVHDLNSGTNKILLGPQKITEPNEIFVDKNKNVYYTRGSVASIVTDVVKFQYYSQILIPAGQTTGTLTVKGINDLTDENDETIILTPTATNAALSSSNAISVTVTDDDLPPVLNFTLAETTINEESSGADVTVSVSNRSAKNIGFKFSTSGVAIKGVDYNLSSDSLTIPAGDSLVTVKIISINDNLVETLESFQLGISSSINISTPYPNLTANISSDDKPSITLSASPTSFLEIEGISTIKATLSAPTSRDIIVNFALSGDAQQNTDYSIIYTTNGTTSAPKMIIPAGQTMITDSIKIKGIEDWANESNESIVITPSSTNAVFPGGALTLTLLDHRIQFTQQATPFPALTESAISWGDFDRDGDQDLAIMGKSLSSGNVTSIYRNDNGVFVDINQNLSKLRNGDLQWVDINKDGFLDLMVSGIGVENSVTVRKTVLYMNNQGTSFSATSNINVVGLSYTKLAFGDLDNDGDLDLAIIGKNDSDQPLFYLYEKVDNQLKYQLISDFYPVMIWDMSSIIDGDLKVGDFDLDGDNDILFKNGYVRNSYNETGNFDFALGFNDLRYEVSKLFNDQNGLTIMGLGSYIGNPHFGSSIFLSFSPVTTARKNGAIAAGDFNNDGLTDILISGENASATGESQLYYQKSNGGFELSDIALAALRNSTADWVDYDVDGDLDLIMTGIHATNGQTTVLYKNDTGIKHNHAPGTPTNLTVTDLGNGFVKFSWDKPTDDYSTFFGYNIRLGTTPGGSELTNTQSNLQTGSRLITAVPPIYTNSYTTQLNPGKYYWSVQAIDQGFQGSPFANEQTYTLQYEWKLINQRGIVNRTISGVDKPKLALLDIDNDNDLDLIMGSSLYRQAYLYDGKMYRAASLNIHTNYGSDGIENIVEGDINNDGLTDLVINSPDKVLRVYFNNGGNFSLVYTASATGLLNTKLKLTDMDNDGLMDIMIAGITSTDDSGVPKFYRIEWQGSVSNFVFTDLSSQIAPLKYASYDFGDFNKDRKIDFVASGYDDNAGLRSILYKNTTIADSTLTLTPTANSFVPVYQGTTDMVDYDGDGDLDIIFTGMVEGPDVFQVYENQLTGENSTFVLHPISIGSLRNARIRFGDFNGDGYQDIFYTGFRDGSGKVTGLAQYNSSTKNYEASAFNYGNLTDAEFAFGDIENDGDLDIILTGNDVNNEYTKIFRALLNVQNESAVLNTNFIANSGNLVNSPNENKIALADSETFRFNTAPSTPKTKSIKLLTVSNKKLLEFAWLAATDDNTPVSGLSYNLRIGTTPTGDEILAANANGDGVRKIAGKGNTEHNLSWNLKMLRDGTYYWSVQAIDASFVGSDFTTPQKFEIINGQLKTYQPPVVGNSTFTISETLAVNTTIGKIQATDPESDPLTYQIISGNTNNWFEVNSSGQIVLKSKPAIFPTQVVLEVKVKDGLNEVTGTVTIKFCESNFSISSDLLNVTKNYKSTNSIQATNKIKGTSIISYEAKNSVALNPGFTVDKGATFSALINGGCTN